MADLFYRRLRQPGVSKLLTSQVDFSGIDFQTIRLEQGSRFLLYLDIQSVTGIVNIVVTHAADQNQDFQEKLNETYAITGPQSLHIMDVQKFVGITIDVTGTATYSLGVTMADNSTSKEAEDLLEDIDAKLGAPLPLPVGAATAAKQDQQTAILQQIEDNTDGLETSISSIDGKVSTSAKQDIGNASLASIDSKLTNPIPVTGPLTDSQLRASPVPVSAASLPLPAGAATSANQVIEIASLASIDSKLTSPLSVTGPLTNTQLRASPVPVSGTVTSNIGTTGGLALETTQQAGNVSLANIDSKLTNPLPISATSLPLPTGASTATKQDEQTALLTDIDSKLTSPISVLGPLTDAELRASPVPVTASIDTTGLALETKQDIGNASLASIDSKLTNPLPVSGTVTANIGTTGGLALETTQVSGNTKLDTIHSDLVTIEGKQDTGNASLASIDSKLTSPISVTGPLTDTQLRASPVPVSASSLPLPTGAATEATLSSLNAKVTVVNTNSVTIVASALPSGASTSALQTTGNASLASIDSKLTNPLPISGTVTANIGTTNGLALDVSVVALQVAQGSTTSGERGTLILGAVTTSSPTYTTAQTSPISLTTAGAVRTDSSATTQPISAAALPLPAGAATSALQTTGNASLSSIDAKLTNPLPVSGPLTDTQLRASPVPISGTVISNIGTTGGLALESTQLTGNSSLSSIDTKLTTTNTEIGIVTETAPASDTASSGLNGRLQRVAQRITSLIGIVATETTLAALSAKFNSLGQKTSANSAPVVLASDQSSIPVTGTFFQATQPVSGTVTANQGTSPWVTSVTGSVTVTGALTDTQLRASPVPISGTVTSNIGTTGGIALETTQLSNGVSLSSIDTKLTTTNTEIGGLTETAPASDTASSGLNGRLQRIAQRITSLIAIAATETTLAALSAKFGSLGQKTMAGSAPVVLASDQSALPITTARTNLVGSTPISVSAGVASGTLIVTNASRDGLVVTNTSTLGVISLHLNNGTAVLGSGITLYPHDSWVMDEYTFTTAQINVIASLAATSVGVQEMV